MESTAYEHLIDVLRGRDMKNFTMTITCHAGVWTVVTTEFGAPDPTHATSAGAGHTFTEAYDQLPLIPGTAAKP